MQTPPGFTRVIRPYYHALPSGKVVIRRRRELIKRAPAKQADAVPDKEPEAESDTPFFVGG